MKKRGRLGLAAWLHKLLQEGNFKEQLWWVNKEEQLFGIRWTHASCASYDAAIDSTLFHEWAKHTGNVKSQSDDAKTWKATFRCALASISTIKRINKKPGKKGKPPCLIYKFVQKSNAKRKPKLLNSCAKSVSNEMPSTITCSKTPTLKDFPQCDIEMNETDEYLDPNNFDLLNELDSCWNIFLENSQNLCFENCQVQI